MKRSLFLFALAAACGVSEGEVTQYPPELSGDDATTSVVDAPIVALTETPSSCARLKAVNLAGANLNVRALPGLTQSIVGHMVENAEADVLGEARGDTVGTTDRWYHVRVDASLSGWVTANYAQCIAQVPPPTCTSNCAPAFGPTVGGLTLLGSQYDQDEMFPQYDCFYRDRQYGVQTCAPNFPGATVHLLLKNTGTSAITLDDVTLEGWSLTKAIRIRDPSAKNAIASIYYSALGSAALYALGQAGEPVWFKTDPKTIAPGQTTQAVVRLRWVPKKPSVTVAAVTHAGTLPVTVSVNASRPRLTSISFSQDLTRVYLYWSHPQNGLAPAQIFMDMNDVTSRAKTVVDPSLNLAVTVLELQQPLAPGSFHVYQGWYADGRMASFGIRSWANPFTYTTWGADPSVGNGLSEGMDWVADAARHGINGLEHNVALSAVGTQAGFLQSQGFNFILDDVSKWNPAVGDPYLWYLRDEPDNAEGKASTLPNTAGTLAMALRDHGEEMRAKTNGRVLTTLNLDGTNKPYNYNNYGQLVDVLTADPYYQARQGEAYYLYPIRRPLYAKATYIYAMAQTVASAASPTPSRLILYSTEWDHPDAPSTFPYAPPQVKRIEVYYALAAGVKGLSYWWFNPPHGLGSGKPAAKALYEEIGVLGNEIKAVQPLLTTAAPIPIDLKATPGVWSRALAVGLDTLIVFAVNDQYYDDYWGFHGTPVQGATLDVGLPSWMGSSASAFEVSAGGVFNLAQTPSAGRLKVNLCRLDVTRMVVITTNPTLQADLASRWSTKVRPGICTMSPARCSTPPPTCAAP